MLSISSDPLLRVEGLSKNFRVGRHILRAVHQASFTLQSGQTLGLVGESGSGKSTLGRTLLHLLKPNEGHVLFDGIDLATLSKSALRKKRKDMQMIFQDPLASLNQRMTIARGIEDPLRIHGIGSPSERRQIVERLLERVGLSYGARGAFPFELSGGQQQRVGIARALTVNPKMIVCDEAVSALDVSIQLQIIKLLRELQREMNLSYIFISHNLAVVEYISDYVAVMYLGEIVEFGSVESVFERPQHPYTRVLIQSILKIPKLKQDQSDFNVITGEIPSPLNPPSGCPFHPRCPIAADICKTKKPVYREVANAHATSCHMV